VLGRSGSASVSTTRDEYAFREVRGPILADKAEWDSEVLRYVRAFEL
jgi:hypothetical protein